MTKSGRKSRQAPVREPAPARVPAPSPEERPGEILTVAWMLCTLFAFVAEMLHLVVLIILAVGQIEIAERNPLYSLLVVLHLVSLTAGITALALIPGVYRTRRVAPPVAVTIFSVFVGLTPLAVVLLRMFIRGA